MHLITGYAAKGHITPNDHGAMHIASICGGDYVADLGDKFAATFSSGVITVKGGHLFLEGRYANKYDETVLTPTLCPAGATRNDLIVARYYVNTATGVEFCEIVLIEGNLSESADPVYGTKSILNDTFAEGDTHDFPLWRVKWSAPDACSLVRLFVPQQNLAKRIEMLDSSLYDLAWSTPTIQTGVATIQFMPGKECSVHVAFPSPFASRPVVLTSQVFEVNSIIVKEEDITNTGFTARVGAVENGGENTYRNFAWVAISR